MTYVVSNKPIVRECQGSQLAAYVAAGWTAVKNASPASGAAFSAWQGSDQYTNLQGPPAAPPLDPPAPPDPYGGIVPEHIYRTDTSVWFVADADVQRFLDGGWSVATAAQVAAWRAADPYLGAQGPPVAKKV